MSWTWSDSLCRRELDRFLARVPESMENGCRLWTGETSGPGYGRFSYWRGGERRSVAAHRLSYAIHVGPIPDGVGLLHSCDTPACIEPTHLRPGDQLANYQDSVDRGRHSPPPHPIGEDHPRAKLTWEAVRYIRSVQGDMTQRDLARLFGVSQTTVRYAQMGKTWSPDPLDLLGSVESVRAS